MAPPKLSKQEQQRIQGLLDTFYGGPIAASPGFLDQQISAIITFVKAGASDEQILALLKSANPKFVSSAEQRSTQDTAGALRGLSTEGVQLPTSGSTANTSNTDTDSLSTKFKANGWVEYAPGKWVNPIDGEKVDLTGASSDGSGAAYAQIAEGRRQFDIEQQRLGKEFEEESAQFTRQEGRLNNQYTMDAMRGMEEFQKNYALQLEQLGLSKQQIAQAAEQFSRSFAENQRQFNTQEGRLGKQLDLEAELGRGGLAETTRSNRAQEADAARQRNLQEQEYMAGVLRNPSDFLARAFMSRGGQSPYKTVTQADLINNLKAGVQGATQGFAKGGATTEGKFTTGEQGKEAILNPTNAPIIVLNNDQTKQMDQEGTPGYATGTGFDPRVLSALGRLPAGTSFGATNFAGGARYMTPDLKYGTTGFGRNGDVGMWGANPSQATDLQGNNWYEEQGGEGPYPGWTGQPGTMDSDTNYMNAKRDADSKALQAWLVAEAKRATPPGAAAALEGGRIPSARPVGQLTPGKLQKLTPGELEALNTRLAIEFNSDLPTEMGLLQQRFGPVVNRSRGRLQV